VATIPVVVAPGEFFFYGRCNNVLYSVPRFVWDAIGLIDCTVPAVTRGKCIGGRDELTYFLYLCVSGAQLLLQRANVTSVNITPESLVLVSQVVRELSSLGFKLIYSLFERRDSRILFPALSLSVLNSDVPLLSHIFK
jgi:hypothetical protein